MKVALDISALDPNFKEHAQRGIGRYVKELKKYFDSLNLSSNEQIAYFSHQNVGGKIGRSLSRAIDYLPAGKATLKQQMLLPFLYRNVGKSNLLHFPAHMDAPSRNMPPYVLTVLDLIPQVLSNLYKADNPNWRFKLARYFENESIKRASLLLCISECTAKDVNRILGIPFEKLRVTPLGIDPKFFAAAAPVSTQDFLAKWQLPTNAPLILYVGGIDPRKNWPFALNVFKELKDRARDAHKAAPVLLMAGRIDKDKEFPKFNATISELGLKDNIKLLGFVPDVELLQLYKLCSAFFFPSLYEGFGLPPLEAMAAGLPVVSSNTSCMPEILGDAVIFIDPTNVKEAAEALWGLCFGQIDSSNLIEKGKKQARKFSWEHTGAKTLECYKEASDGLRRK